MSGKLTLLDPTGDVKAGTARMAARPSDIWGKSIGLVYNGHFSTLDMWRALDQGLRSKLGDSRVMSFVKPNVSAQAPKEVIEELAKSTNLALVGAAA